jgi:predicted RNase H-like HicB family nuclease
MSLSVIESGAQLPDLRTADDVGLAGYVVVLEAAAGSWGAYVPDLPGVVAAADTEEEVRTLIADAIEFHLEGLREDGDPIPAPTTSTVLWVHA